jgi:anti-anti-sigma factor
MLRAEMRASRLGGTKETIDLPTDSQPNDVEKRIEDWVVSHLEDRPLNGEEQVDWHDLIAENALVKRDPKRKRPGPAAGAKREPWSRFRVTRRKGITILRLRDAGLVRESDLHELSEELSDLLGAGPRRVVLNFGNVERLSCQAVGILAETHRRHTAHGDAMLKVCALQPTVAELFETTGLGRELPVHPDEPSAIETPWPANMASRRLPVTILNAMREGRRVTQPRLRSRPAPAEPRALKLPRLPHTTPVQREGESETPMLEVRLIARSGRLEGREVSVRRRTFVLGRGPSCHLRSRNSTVSRRHASLEQVDGRVILRDLGSRNGTFLNGSRLGSSAVNINDGDVFQIGPLQFSVAIGERTSGAAPVDDVITSWLADEPYGSAGATEELTSVRHEALGLDECEADDALRSVRIEVVEDVLVVMPLSSHLDEEATVGPLRAGLYALHERDLPRQVVIDMSRVTHISSLGIGVLLAHNLRLDRSGGAMRLCALQPRVQAILEEIRLPMLIDTLPSRDEAILASWSRDDV